MPRQQIIVKRNYCNLNAKLKPEFITESENLKLIFIVDSCKV